MNVSRLLQAMRQTLTESTNASEGRLEVPISWGGQNLLLWDYGDYYPIMIMVHYYYYPIYDDYYDKYSKTCPEEFGIGSL